MLSIMYTKCFIFKYIYIFSSWVLLNFSKFKTEFSDPSNCILLIHFGTTDFL